MTNFNFEFNFNYEQAARYAESVDQTFAGVDFWSMPVEGTYVVRVLPGEPYGVDKLKSRGQLGVQLYKHWLQAGDGEEERFGIHLCGPSMDAERYTSCAVCKRLAELRVQNHPHILATLLKDGAKPKARGLLNIQVIHDAAKPENNGKLVMWDVPGQTYAELHQWLTQPGGYQEFWHPVGGRNVMVTREGRTKNKTRYSVRPELQQHPVAATENEIRAILEQLPDLSQFQILSDQHLQRMRADLERLDAWVNMVTTYAPSGHYGAPLGAMNPVMAPYPSAPAQAPALPPSVGRQVAQGFQGYAGATGYPTPQPAYPQPMQPQPPQSRPPAPAPQMQPQQPQPYYPPVQFPQSPQPAQQPNQPRPQPQQPVPPPAAYPQQQQPAPPTGYPQPPQQQQPQPAPPTGYQPPQQQQFAPPPGYQPPQQQQFAPPSQQQQPQAAAYHPGPEINPATGEPVCMGQFRAFNPGATGTEQKTHPLCQSCNYDLVCFYQHQ